MMYLDLDGTWTAGRAGEKDFFNARVPGCIHADLLEAGRIDDPNYSDNEKKQMWIGETDWVYFREFDLPSDFLEADRLLLRFLGLDTFAEISVNGKKLAETDNQFRTYEFDIRDYAGPGVNRIEVKFISPFPYIKKKQKERYFALTGEGMHRISGSNLVRKSQCNFGWDWGPMAVTCGIWRSTGIAAYSKGRILETEIRQDHSKKNRVTVSITSKIRRFKTDKLNIRAVLSYHNEEIQTQDADVLRNTAELVFPIHNPKLWWPNNMGEQNTYMLKVELQDEAGQVLDSVEKTLGLRTLVLKREDDAWGESFHFEVNGVPFFAKGANWIPADTFVSRLGKEDYDYLLSSARDANMNMLRVWGGGIYEDDTFYELCTEYGLCVWQDFMFACSAYPVTDGEWLKSFKAEASDNIKRLRHHACIALWCGNNEIEQIGGLVGPDREAGEMSWAEYKKLFDRVIPSLLSHHDQDRDYWPSSPHSPKGDRKDVQNPKWGDAHLWEVWHGRKPFEWYYSCEHRFNSEFGFQSFPEPKVVEKYTVPEDRNITSYIMELHQRSRIGNETIILYMLSWFRLPKNHEMTLWTSQILQGMAMKYAVEHWRRSMPRGMGTLYWQLNDCWPVASWSSIDYYGNWKALHYMARNFFAPVLITVVEDSTAGTAEVHVMNDMHEKAEGDVLWTLTDVNGKIIAEDGFPAAVGPGKAKKIKKIKLADSLKAAGERKLFLEVRMTIKGSTVSRNFCTFTRPKHLELADPELELQVLKEDDASASLLVRSRYPALWVWIDSNREGLLYSEQFFHLIKDREKKITVRKAGKNPSRKRKTNWSVFSLYDTYR